MRRLEVAAQNLSNLNTAGYKADGLAFSEVLGGYTRIGAGRPGGLVAIGQQQTNFAQGAVERTGNPFDLAIEGEGFFAVRTPQGVRYTRQGSFRLASDGAVVTPLGYALLGQGGPIRVDDGMEVTPEGVVFSNGAETDRIRVVRFGAPQELKKVGQGLFDDVEGQAREATSFRVLQGNLERSNVNPIETMITLITLNREFESYQRALRLMDDATVKMLNEGARV
jgi:flagellar basal-body rod protein FlgG